MTLGVKMDWERVYDRISALDAIDEATGAHGTIQLKGTQLCVDLHCPCGTHSHVDADFFYHFQCIGCEKKYHVGSVIKLYEATPEEAAAIERHGVGTIGREFERGR